MIAALTTSDSAMDFPAPRRFEKKKNIVAYKLGTPLAL